MTKAGFQTQTVEKGWEDKAGFALPASRGLAVLGWMAEDGQVHSSDVEKG